MCVNSTIVLERQSALRRAIDRRKMLLKIVVDDSGLPYSTVASYLPENQNVTPHMMSLAAFFTLVETEAIPLDLLSRLLPEGCKIVKEADAPENHKTANATIDAAIEALVCLKNERAA